MLRMNKVESPAVEKAIKQKRLRSKMGCRALLMGCLNLMLALAIYYEMSYQLLMTFSDTNVQLLTWLIEWSLIILFSLSSLTHFLRYFFPSFSSLSIVELTPGQFKLLAVARSDPGFKLATPPDRKSPSPSWLGTPSWPGSPSCPIYSSRASSFHQGPLLRRNSPLSAGLDMPQYGPLLNRSSSPQFVGTSPLGGYNYNLRGGVQSSSPFGQTVDRPSSPLQLSPRRSPFDASVSPYGAGLSPYGLSPINSSVSLGGQQPNLGVSPTHRQSSPLGGGGGLFGSASISTRSSLFSPQSQGLFKTPSPTSHLVGPARTIGSSGSGASPGFGLPVGSLGFGGPSHSPQSQSQSALFQKSSNAIGPLMNQSQSDYSMTGYQCRTNVVRSPQQSVPVRSGEDVITDQKSLQSMLEDEEKRENVLSYVSSMGTLPQEGGAHFSSPTFHGSYNRGLANYASLLKKNQYQIACRSPQSAKTRDDDTDDSKGLDSDEVWHKFGVSRDQLDHWVESLRKWISQTILVRLVNEIDGINKKLAAIGSEDMLIGDISIGVVKQLAVTKAQYLPTLGSLVQFLEVSQYQEYVVKRIRELATGGCMDCFKWNGGGSYKGKQWEESLPTDSEIVMHMLCSYLDARLPPHPNYRDGKTFTNQFFCKTPDKPDLNKKEDSYYVYMVKLHPPYYKLIIGDESFNLPRGRTNLFHVILLFLQYVRIKEHGILGRVNLGLSGINILWVLENSCDFF